MHDLTISIFGNKILLEIINELKQFSKYKIQFQDNFNDFFKDSVAKNKLAIIFITEENKKNYANLDKIYFPIIVISKILISKKILSSEFFEKLSIPFKIEDLEKKIISLLARYKFKQESLIELNGYIINKNERTIKKNDLLLQLTEKEINFLILFSKNKKTLKRDFVLKKVWNYSSKSDTHTVETHIHRLRKKIAEKFNDINFIKNNNKGYYI